MNSSYGRCLVGIECYNHTRIYVMIVYYSYIVILIILFLFTIIIWLVVWNICYFPISYMGCHPFDWRTASFFKMVKTTNQLWLLKGFQQDEPPDCKSLVVKIRDWWVSCLLGIWIWWVSKKKHLWFMWFPSSRFDYPLGSLKGSVKKVTGNWKAAGVFGTSHEYRDWHRQWKAAVTLRR